MFFIPSEENRIIEQQGTVNNRTFVLLNFRSIIPALTIYCQNLMEDSWFIKLAGTVPL